MQQASICSSSIKPQKTNIKRKRIAKRSKRTPYNQILLKFMKEKNIIFPQKQKQNLELDYNYLKPFELFPFMPLEIQNLLIDFRNDISAFKYLKFKMAIYNIKIPYDEQMRIDRMKFCHILNLNQEEIIENYLKDKFKYTANPLHLKELYCFLESTKLLTDQFKEFYYKIKEPVEDNNENSKNNCNLTYTNTNSTLIEKNNFDVNNNSIVISPEKSTEEEILNDVIYDQEFCFKDDEFHEELFCDDYNKYYSTANHKYEKDYLMNSELEENLNKINFLFQGDQEF